MKILSVTLTVEDLAESVRFYRDVLNMTVDENAEQALIHAGSSRLILIPGERFDGVHHLAFGIVPSEFELAHSWLSTRAPILVDNGSEIIHGPAGWNSRSLYFLGPEDIILELIARDADAEEKSANGESPRILSISEIGIGVPDVPATVTRLSEDLAISPFFEPGDAFAPLGDDDGLLIVVRQERIWFPTKTLRPARGSLAVRIESSIANKQIDLTSAISIATTGSAH